MFKKSEMSGVGNCHSKEVNRSASGSNRPHYFILAAASLIFLFSRLTRLADFPIFNDEAFYVRWATFIHANPFTDLFLPLVDGKTPLFIWFNAIIVESLSDPLLTGRLTSVFGGVLSLIGIYIVGARLFSRRAASIAVLVHCLIPYAAINERLATVDGFFHGVAALVLAASVYVSEKDAAFGRFFLLGLAMSAAFFTKTPALLLMPLPLLMFLVLAGPKALNKRNIIGFAIAYALPAITFAIYMSRNVQILGGEGSMIFHRSRFFMSAGEILSFPLSQWALNFRDLWAYMASYVTWPYITLVAAGAYLAAIKKDMKSVAVLIWFLLPALLITLVTKETFSRYYFFILAPLTILCGEVISQAFDFLRSKTKNLGVALGVLIGVVLAVPSIIFQANLVFNPSECNWMPRDRWQYVEGWPAGKGIREAVQWIESAASNDKILVFTSMKWGNPSDAISIFLRNNGNVKVVECFWLLKAPIFYSSVEGVPELKSKFHGKELKPETIDPALYKRAFLVVNTHFAPIYIIKSLDPDAKEVFRFSKGALGGNIVIMEIPIPKVAKG